MPTQVVSVGRLQAILQNVAWALPGKLVHITASAAIEYSIDGTTWVALTGANTVGVYCSATFIRCPGGNCNVICKSM